MRKIVKGLLVAGYALSMCVSGVGSVDSVKCATGYEKTINKISKSSNWLKYSIMDLVDGSKKELLIAKDSGGSATLYEVYAKKNGKVNKVLSQPVYGLGSIKIYSKSGGVVMYGAGHGHEVYYYLKKTKGIYKLVASKGRDAIAGGNVSNGKWHYNNSAGASLISKKRFDKLVKGLNKGKCKTIKDTQVKWVTKKQY